MKLHVHVNTMFTCKLSRFISFVFVLFAMVFSINSWFTRHFEFHNYAYTLVHSFWGKQWCGHRPWYSQPTTNGVRASKTFLETERKKKNENQYLHKCSGPQRRWQSNSTPWCVTLYTRRITVGLKEIAKRLRLSRCIGLSKWTGR